VSERGRARALTGVVKSTKMDKTIVVLVTRQFPHPQYKKTVRRRKAYYAHDGENTCRPGDTV